MSYMDIASLATQEKQANVDLSAQMWGIKSMTQNQSNVVQELLAEVSPSANQSNNPEGTGVKINTQA